MQSPVRLDPIIKLVHKTATATNIGKKYHKIVQHSENFMFGTDDTFVKRSQIKTFFV